MGHETIDISGDVGIRAFGADCAEAWAEAAVGMYGLITDLDAVSETRLLDISVSAENIESLLVRFLNELIFHFDAYGYVGKRVVVTSFSERAVTAGVAGEEFNPGRHERRLLLKAATYHNIRIAQDPDGCSVAVIFDI